MSSDSSTPPAETVRDWKNAATDGLLRIMLGIVKQRARSIDPWNDPVVLTVWNAIKALEASECWMVQVEDNPKLDRYDDKLLTDFDEICKEFKRKAKRLLAASVMESAACIADKNYGSTETPKVLHEYSPTCQ